MKDFKLGDSAEIENENHILTQCVASVAYNNWWLIHLQDYFDPQQNISIVHTKHDYKSCLDTSNTWKTTKYHKIKA